MITPEYAAGFFDGEGCVSLRHGSGRARNHIRLQVQIANTFLPVLEAFKFTYGGYISTPRQKKVGHKPFWTWCAVSEHAIAFLRVIRPFVRVKTAQVELALEFSEFRATPKSARCEFIHDPSAVTGGRGWRRTEETLLKEAEFQARMLKLNQRGIPLS